MDELQNQKSAVNQPPQAIEVERAVLGAIMLERDAIDKVASSIQAECFYDKKNQIIYEAMLSLYESNEPIDSVTLYEELSKRNKIEQVGGAVYISKLAQNIASAANVEYHSKIILEKWILRKLINSSMEIATSAYNGSEDVFDILDSAESKIFEITEAGLKESYKSMDRAVREAIEHIEAIHSKNISSFSVPTGFFGLDDMLGGFQKSDLIIVAARPSMGKTAFALSAARNAAVDNQVPIAVFSLEMATIQLVLRLICAEARINAHSVRTGRFKAEDGSRISRTAHKLMQAPIYIDDTPGQTVLEIRAKARRLKAEKNIGLIIIDYLQLMSSSTRMDSREREISTISRSLKALAKELNVPVIALSQLNRAVETRSDKRPQLSDLRESGSIEQDADVVIFLNRPEYYGITQFADGESTEGIAEIIVGKQRNGPTGDVRLKFVKDFARFENLDMFHSTFEEDISSSNHEEDLPI
ncbi:MAG: replicative DNA helicase [Ignavibacteriae bacterium]|nr:replicative DNA helicase [Ignavibacteriota bacterium]